MDEGDERYAFTWPGKADAIRQSQTTTTATLRPVVEKSRSRTGEDGSFDSDNIYIEGDNLEVLKLLQRAYHGKVKMIYIDPPYNTGHDFVYKDKFGDTIENYKEQTGQANQSNPETSGRFHSDWCSMMYPRLKLARELLADDGVIFISIDDNEQMNLRKVCDEIFGEDNFVATFVHQRAKGGGQARWVVRGHDYVHAYAKRLSRDVVFGRKKVVQGKTQFINGKECIKNDDVVRKKFGKYEKGTERRCLYEELLDYKGPEFKAGIDKKLESGELFLEDWADGKHAICRWEPLDTATSKPYSIIKVLSERGKSDLERLGITEFPYPKPVDFVKEIIELSTPLEKNALVLDFFSGSATTAHAVMRANVEKANNRKFIVVQLPETCEEGSIAGSAGHQTICDIGEERIRRAGDKIAEEVAESNKQLKLGEEPKQLPDIGFRVFKLDESGIEEPKEGQLLIDRRKQDRSDLDIIFEVMLKWGYELTYPIEKAEFAGYGCYSVAAGDLICCMEPGLSVDALEAIAAEQPRRVFVMDSAFEGSDSLKLDALAIFKRVEEQTQQKIDLRTV